MPEHIRIPLTGNVKMGGGHLPSDAYAGFGDRLRYPRCEDYSLTPAEIIDILERNLNRDRWYGVTTDANRWGNRLREERGFRHRWGTVFFYNLTEKVNVATLPLDSLPYVPILTAEWDEDMRRFHGGYMVPGWRAMFARLARSGDLLSTPEIEYLIGEYLSENSVLDT